MLDSSVKITNTKSVVGFDPQTSLPSKKLQIDFMVGTHGPFTITTTQDQFTPEYLETETGKVVSTLRSVGAI